MNAVLVFDKPGGMSSQQAVTRVKRAFGVKKAGHAGTLDPLATGVLLVCLGEATKISSHLMGLPKLYEATMRLGEARDTGDIEGEVIETAPVPALDREGVERAMSSLTGEIMQTPPMYSALKRDGVPLYRLARQGVTVERQPRLITVYAMKLLALTETEIRFQARCSKGTYVRTLIEDLGRALGTVACMTALRRLSVGDFSVERAATLDDLDNPGSAAVSVDDALMHLSDIVLAKDDFEKARHGGRVFTSNYKKMDENEIVKLKNPHGEFFALGRVHQERIKVERMLHLGVEA